MIDGLDHPVIAVGDLDAAALRYAALLGGPPWWRGVHPGMGTANALFEIGGVGLELLTPRGEGPVGAVVARVLEGRGEGLVALAFATSDAKACAEALRGRGLAAGDPRDGEGSDESGAVRRWRTVDLPLAATRGLVVFAIERRGGPAPPGAVAAPDGVAAIDHVVVTTPDLEAARRLYGEQLGLRLALDRGFEARGLRMLFFRIAGVTVEVVGPLEPPTDPAPTDAFGGLAYRVEDVERARARLVAAGFDVSEVRRGAKPGTRVATVRDGTCGVPTLLIEPSR